MLVILDTSQFAIGPCGPLAQLPSGDSFTHSASAVRNSFFVRGLNFNTAVEDMVSVRVKVRVSLRSDRVGIPPLRAGVRVHGLLLSFDNVGAS